MTVEMEGRGPVDSPFNLGRDRDAWATIRGFVYQVDRTIAAWLDLGADEVLELERGEDIDRITSALHETGEGQRRLEQVKHREPRLTLRSDVAREALANFFQHRGDNPGQILRFRFTTTASIGRERHNRLPDGKPGIVAWEQVRQCSAADVTGPILLRGLRELVLSLPKPAAVPSEQWTGFQSFVGEANDDAWHDFVAAFEWSTGASDSPSLRPQIQTRLRRESAVGSQRDAEIAYQRLFFVVFDKLTKKGLKRLAHDELHDALEASSERTNPALFAELASLHDALADRVDALEQRALDVDRVLAGMAADISERTRAAGIVAQVDTRAGAAFSTAPPMRAGRSSDRTLTVKALLAFGGPRVTILIGNVMAGKTQLALLLSERLGSTPVWIRLSAAAPSDAGTRLSQAVDSVLASSHELHPRTQDWSDQCAALAASADVIVLDDVPSFRDGDDLGNRLMPLIAAFLAADRSVVLTSTVPLLTIERLLGPESVSVMNVPPLTTSDITEVLDAYSAPPEVCSPQFTRVLLSVTGGHPIRVQAAAQWLHRRNWKTDLQALDSIIRGNFAESVNRETAQVLLNSVNDAATREFLYRLALVGGEFGRDELAALAEVAPAIEQRAERFTALYGPWVQSATPNRYAVSPLLRGIGDDNLEPSVLRQCHAVLGHLIVQRGSIGELEFSSAMAHFIASEDMDTAAILLVHGLWAVYNTPPQRETLITRAWSDMPIPHGVARPLKAMIRACQAAIAHRDGRDPEFFLEELTATLDASPQLEPWAQFGPAAFVGIAFARADTAIAAPFVERALARWWELRDSSQEALHDGSGVFFPELESLAWVSLIGLKDIAGLEAWIHMVTALPRELVDRLFASPFGVAMSKRLADSVLLWEYDASSSTRDWNRAGERLLELEAVAERIGALSLFAGARSARITALIEGERGLDQGQVLAESTLTEFPTNFDVTFLAAKAMGLGALDLGHTAVSREWFVSADSFSGTTHVVDRLRVKLRLAQLNRGVDPLASIASAEEAVAMSSQAQESFLPPHVEAEYGQGIRGDIIVPSAIGELALAHWFADDRPEAYRIWLTALEALIERHSDDEPSWKSLFVVMGHVTAYLTGIATDGEPPSQTLDGDPCGVPRQGMLIAPKREAATLFRSNRVPTLGILAMQLADVVGDEALAVRWASRAADGLRKLELWTAAAIPERRLLEDAILRGDFLAAIQHATEAVLAHWAAEDRTSDPGWVFTPSDAPRRVLENQSDGDRTSMDGMIVTLAVLPAFLHVALELERNAEQSDILSRDLHAACLATAEADPTSIVWPEVVAICEATFGRTPDLGELKTRGERLQNLGEAFRSTAVLSMVGGSLDPTAAPQSRAMLQLAGSDYFLTILAQGTILYERLAVPFYSLFWRRVFNEGRIHFLAPAVIERQLDDADQAPPSQRPQLVLKTIAWGLNLRLRSAKENG